MGGMGFVELSDGTITWDSMRSRAKLGSQMNSKKRIWRLKAGADRRFRSGHPWIYSNELMESPKGIEPGEEIELHDAGGKFLAHGYGNPYSLIAFRVLTREADNAEPLSQESLTKTLASAKALRVLSGLAHVSYRLCFGEADRLPGLIIDRYLLEGGQQVFAIQAHTAGVNRVLENIFAALEALYSESWKSTAVVLRNDLHVRKLEGLEPEPVRVIRPVANLDLARARILIMGSLNGTAPFETDLLEGQKTGFFLDQGSNIQLAARKLGKLQPEKPNTPLRILDLCCYVGQWSTQLTRAFRENGIACDVTLVDASASALERASRNVEAQEGRCTAMKANVLDGLTGLSDQSFDLIVCDPPALIKGRKDIHSGAHAYLQLNTQVFRLIRAGGAVVSCSCSALFEEEQFRQVLAKAANRNRRRAQWLARGSQGPDHPMLAEFPEGQYLKCWIGAVDC